MQVEVPEDLPEVTSPSLEELAEDVAAAHVEPQVQEPEAEEPEVQEAEAAEGLPEDDGPVNVKSVETVSAMDLIMGAAEESASEQDDSESEQDAEGPAPA